MQIFQVLIFFRNDSPSGLAKHGVGLYLCTSLKVGQVSKVHPNTLAIFLPDFNIYVIVVYRPPNNSQVENIKLLTFLQSFCYDKDVVFMGDFNLPSIGWCDLVPVATSSLSQLFLDMFVLSLKKWYQHNLSRSLNVSLHIVLVLVSMSFVRCFPWWFCAASNISQPLRCLFCTSQDLVG